LVILDITFVKEKVTAPNAFIGAAFQAYSEGVSGHGYHVIFRARISSGKR